jgi:hypothetical protein
MQIAYVSIRLTDSIGSTPMLGHIYRYIDIYIDIIYRYNSIGSTLTERERKRERERERERNI